MAPLNYKIMNKVKNNNFLVIWRNAWRKCPTHSVYFQEKIFAFCD